MKPYIRVLLISLLQVNLKYINLKNLSKQKKITKKVSSELHSQLESTNQTYGLGHEIEMTL
jgi:hypothetical protein